MATLGNVPAEAYTNTVKDSFSGNGSATAFTMSLPTVTNDVRVVVENVIQDPTVAYSVSGTTLTFTSAPPTGTNNIYVVHLGPAVMTTVPPAEIADATTFASSLTVQGAFTSQGIDDNGDAVALTITSDEQVLIGKTSTGLSVTGTQITSDGRLMVTRDGNQAADFNRKSSDGDIVKFQKDGTTVGSIGVAQSGDRTYFSGGSYGIASDTSDATLMPCNTSGGGNDNTVNLGKSDARFKDLHLAGGIYLGGTGSANKLDDYEEGTYSPEKVNGGTVNYSQQNGWYIKVGNLVTVYMDIVIDSASGESGNAQITLPFTSQSGNSYMAFNPWIVDTGYTSTTKKAKGFVNGSSNRMQMYRINSGNSSGSSYAYQNVTGRWSGVIQYFTA